MHKTLIRRRVRTGIGEVSFLHAVSLRRSNSARQHVVSYFMSCMSSGNHAPALTPMGQDGREEIAHLDRRMWLPRRGTMLTGTDSRSGSSPPRGDWGAKKHERRQNLHESPEETPLPTRMCWSNLSVDASGMASLISPRWGTQKNNWIGCVSADRR